MSSPGYGDGYHHSYDMSRDKHPVTNNDCIIRRLGLKYADADRRPHEAGVSPGPSL
jgi:hypothetical protein